MKRGLAILNLLLVFLLWTPLAQAAVVSDPARSSVNVRAFEDLLSDINARCSASRAAMARNATMHGHALVEIDGTNTAPYYPAPSNASAIVHEFIVALDPACTSTNPSVPAQMHAILTSLASTVSYEYSAALNAYRVRYTPSASFPEFPHEMLARVPCIRYIEQLQTMRITAAPPQVETLPAANAVPGIANASVANLAGALWGLDRLDAPISPSPPALVDGRYSFDLTGRGVHIYVIDSGISATHPEYAGRAELAYTVTSISPASRSAGPDCTGHGSNVAAIAAGLNVGVAKAATVHAVRVLGCEETTNADVVEAIDWVVTHHQRPAVINLSLGPQPNENGQYSRVRSIDESIARAIASGITVVVAAGNDQLDCCGGSPAGADGAIAVGATTLNPDNKRDIRAPFSNFGPCVTLSAPGMDIISAAGANGVPPGTYAMLRGTSQAAPYVTGVVAQLLQAFPELKPAEVAAALRKLAVPNAVGDARTSPAWMVRSATVALAEQVLNRTAKFSAATAIQAIAFPSGLSPATFDPSLGVSKGASNDNAANMVEYSGKATRSAVIAGVVGGTGAVALGAVAILVYLRRRSPPSLEKSRRSSTRADHQLEPPTASLWDDAGHEPVAPPTRRAGTSPPADLPSVPRVLGEQDTSSVVAELQGPSLFRLSRFAQVQPAHTKAGVSRGLRLSMGDSLVTETNRDSRFVSTPPRMSMRPTTRPASMSRPVPPLPPSRVEIKYPTPVFPGQDGAIPSRLLQLQQGAAAASPVPPSDLAIVSPTSSPGFVPPFAARIGAYPRDSEIATDVTTTSISHTPPPVSRTAPSLVPRPADTLTRGSLPRLHMQDLAAAARPLEAQSAPEPPSVTAPVLPAIPASDLADIDAFFDQVAADLALLDPEASLSSK
ncbi:hypothetical protein AMAG_05246 [Allomyces macrogynus ATCC 38327]|uniref:Peptidase S8/S53 domain-containing protein n=1 Tax=Allomyces macrogynus (strain ATCC 38327) TaxID=578462 RepID=A0A0L0SB38_ALLM3|nr:hypothetical protein, variant [Allomyces macrogynus ATCC 38327]KNE59784.1 hypothetical protein AMAG_05246 [Allomyces macrogynus ATCC 38327]|eukprot:KNE59783.1 hypothetical protein, variant [Allomyces macrogynus ATCC 38327]